MKSTVGDMSVESDERAAAQLLLGLLEMIHGWPRWGDAVRIRHGWAEELQAARVIVRRLQRKYGESIMSHRRAIARGLEMDATH